MEKILRYLTCFSLCIIFGIFRITDATLDVSAGFCAVSGADVVLNCSVTPPESSSLLWTLNDVTLAYRCSIFDQNFRELIEVIDGCDEDEGIFNLRLLNFNETLQGNYTCLFNQTTYSTINLYPTNDSTDPGVCTAASNDPDNEANKAQNFSSKGKDVAGKVTLQYSPDGCYYPDPLFRWFGPDGEITDGITTNPTGANCQNPQHSAYSSRFQATFPETKSTENYTCRVAYQDSPDFFVNEKKFYVTLLADCSGLCIGLCTTLIVLVIGGTIAGVVYYFKRPSKRNKQNTTM